MRTLTGLGTDHIVKLRSQLVEKSPVRGRASRFVDESQGPDTAAAALL